MLSLSVIVGRLGRDPEPRTTQGGHEMARISVATSRRVRRGEAWEDQAEWHEVTLWGQPASYAGEHARKGDLVLVVGEPRSRTWEDAQGPRRHAHEVVVGGPQHVFRRLLPAAAHGDGGAEAREEETTAAAPARAEAPASRGRRRAPAAAAAAGAAELAEDLPF